MPEQYHPPNVNQPRVLNRWLDVNSQNGPISRTGTYFTIPAFSITVDTPPISYIVGRFLYNAPNNFSITTIPDLSNLTCLLVIAFDDFDGTVKRYKLNDYAGISVNDTFEQYTNQRIYKTFYIEVWSDEVLTVSSAALTFYTSKKNSTDYRFGLDTALLTTPTIDTLLYCQIDSGNFNLPLTFDSAQ